MKKKARRKLKKRTKQLMKELRRTMDKDDRTKPVVAAGAAAAVAVLDRTLWSDSNTLGDSLTTWLQERLSEVTGTKLGQAH